MANETLVEATQYDARENLPAPPARFHRPWTVLIGLIFLLVPAFAYLFGDRAKPIENRALAPAPSLSDGWHFFPATSTWFTDHLPLRREAIRTNTWISKKVYGEEPSYGSGSSGGTGPAGLPSGTTGPKSGGSVQYPQVVVGTGGWLYVGLDFERPCKPTRTLDETFARLRRLERMVTDSGRRFVFTVAPDKSTIVPDHLPSTYIGKDCATIRKRQFWKRLRADPLASYFDLRGPLERQQKADGAPIFTHLDTHWNQHGSVVYAMELAKALDPSIGKGDQAVHFGSTMKGGDLAGLLGETRLERVPIWRLVRPGVISKTTDKGAFLGPRPVEVKNATTGARLFVPRTAVIGDSFSFKARVAISPIFADMVALRLQSVVPATLGQEIARSKVVVLEAVERSLVGGYAEVLKDDRLEAIRAALAHP